MKKPEVYLDMDGVLADFFTEYAKLAGIESGNYRDIPPAKTDPTLNKMVGTDFFARLPKLRNADQLVAMIVKLYGHYHICSSPLRGDHENSEKQKKIWIQKNLNPQPVDIIITPNKAKFAKQADGTPNILIDDRGSNISAWEAAGGIGIKYQADEDGLDVVVDGLARARKILKGEEEHKPQQLKSLDRSSGKLIAKSGDDDNENPDKEVKESASVGATASGNVASATATGGGWLFGGNVGAPKGKKKEIKRYKENIMNEGKKDRRDPIRTIKPKNPVAKAHQNIGTGSGAHKDKKKAMKQGEVKHKGKEFAENFDAEYDDEAGMADNNLETMKRAVQGIDDLISAGDNLPEWCQEKIAVAKSMLVTVWDYMKSEEERGVTEYGDTARGQKMLTKVQKRAVDRVVSKKADTDPKYAKKNQDTANRAWDRMTDKDVAEGLRDPKDNPCWKGYKPVGTKKKGGRTVPNCVPKEAFDIGMGQASHGKNGPGVYELNKSTLGSYVKKASQDIVDRSSSASYKSGAAGDKYNKADTSHKERRREKGIDRALAKLTKESWTHDSLAAKLFETENTYEDYLKNLLSKKLGK